MPWYQYDTLYNFTLQVLGAGSKLQNIDVGQDELWPIPTEEVLSAIGNNSLIKDVVESLIVTTSDFSMTSTCDVLA